MTGHIFISYSHRHRGDRRYVERLIGASSCGLNSRFSFSGSGDASS